MTSLLRQRVIRVGQGDWRGRDITDGLRTIGWAQRGVLHDANGQLVADVRRRKRDDGLKVWVVEDAFGQAVGNIVPTSRIGWRGRVKLATPQSPFGFTGTVQLVGSERDVADVRGGAVINADGSLAAEVLLGEKRWFGSRSMWGEWTLKFHHCDDPQLRVMCFGWLALAWQFQNALDSSD